MKNNIIVAFFILLGMFISIRSLASEDVPQDIKANMQKAVELIASTPPVRHIVEAKNLHWQNTGAFVSTQTIKPELYGSYYNGNMYSWKNGKIGSLQAHLNEIRSLANATMITWGKEVPSATIAVPVEEGQVSVEAVTGCGYFNTKSAGWETGTIYDFKGESEMKFAHVWSVSPNGRLFLWETLCEGGAKGNVAKCQTQLEKAISGKSPSDLSINLIVADPAEQGVIRYADQSG